MRQIIISIINSNSNRSSSGSIAAVIICLSVIDRSLCSSSGPAHLHIVTQSVRCGRGVSHRHLVEHICSIPPTASGAGEGPRVAITAHLKVSLFNCSVS